MVYHVEGNGVKALEPTSFDALNLTEADIEEWIIETPSILGETYWWSPPSTLSSIEQLNVPMCWHSILTGSSW